MGAMHTTPLDPDSLPAPVQPDQGTIAGATYVTATPDTMQWGRLPTEATPAVARMASGSTITFDTVSHEGLLGDQGADPAAFFGRWGIPRGLLLDDVVALTGSSLARDLGSDGPHAVIGPVEVAGAEVGDVLCIETLDLVTRVGYGIVSNRHGRGVLAGEMPCA